MISAIRDWSRFSVDPSLPQIMALAPSSAFQSVLNSGRPAAEAEMAHKLFIGGLSFSTSSERLRELFTQAGTVESATVVMDRDSGRSRGFGFVEMATAPDAEAAMSKFNGQDVDGRILTVQRANPTGASGRGGGRPGGRW
jgi:cold-inducible RNA-binding protein